MAARSYVRSNACRKGEPNLTGKMFSDWIKIEHKCNVHEKTACCWLHKLGFSRIHHQKGVYFDGHERGDVVAYRQQFLGLMNELDKKSLTCLPQLSPGEKIRVAHDECTYYANCDQSLDTHTNVLRHWDHPYGFRLH